MKLIWTLINSKEMSLAKKNSLFLILNTLIFSLIGFITWFAIHFFTFNKISWAICFTGYPGFFVGFVGGIIYLYQQDI